MSKLADAIRRSQRVEATPMGFGAARPATKSSMLVGFRGDAGAAATAEESADFLLIEADADSASAKELRSKAGELPLGLLLKNAGTPTKELREAGVDFLAVEPGTPASVLLDDDMGYVFV